jgi:hypothetical protein
MQFPLLKAAEKNCGPLQIAQAKLVNKTMAVGVVRQNNTYKLMKSRGVYCIKYHYFLNILHD